MFGSLMLDVLIGLVVLFFVMSVTCSAITEALAGLRRWRASTLRSAICSLLSGTQSEDNDAVRAFKSHPIISALSTQTPTWCAKGVVGWPSYLDADTFTTALLDLISADCISSAHRRTFWALRQAVIDPRNLPNQSANSPAQPAPAGATTGLAKGIYSSPSIDLLANPMLQQTLQAFVETATAGVSDDVPGADSSRLVLFRSQIAAWYDQTMDRATGWYKQKIQKVTLALALALSLLLNLDTIKMFQYLLQAPSARSGLVAMAEHATTQPSFPTATQATTQEAVSAVPQNVIQNWRDIETTGIPLGWRSHWPSWQYVCTGDFWRRFLIKVGGLLITAFATSLGAPFWFDTLSKIVSLRNAGPKPDKSDSSMNPQTTGTQSDEGADAAQSPAPSVAAGTSGVTPAATPAATLPDNYWSAPARARDIETFLPASPGYTAAKAAMLGRCALLAYQPPANIKQTISQAWKVPLGDIQTFTNDGEQAFAFATDDFVIVAFRGTVPAVLNTIIADARICLTTGPVGRVHCGFQDALQKILDAPVTDAQVGLQDFLGKHKAKPLFLTGHSLGAAIASVYSAKLLANACYRWAATPAKLTAPAGNADLPSLSLFTFGSPRVGDHTFCDALDQWLAGATFRFVNDEDLVTRVAPREFGYDHVNSVYVFDAQGILHANEEWWIRFLNTVVNALNDFKAEASTSVKDHAMELYLRKLDNSVV